DTISSGFGRLFAISDPPFPNHNGGPLQWGRISRIEGDHPYVFLDGIVMKRSWADEVRNVSLLVAIGVTREGYREILGIVEGPKEDKSGWSAFLRHLLDCGLSGVRLIVSDACRGLVGREGAKRSQKDTDARWTQKHGKSHYGYKNHVNLDRQHKLVRRYHVSDAALHDSQAVDHLLMRGNTGAGVWADPAYRSAEMEAKLRARGLKSHIHRKGKRGKPLTEQGKASNRTKSAVRARVEHVFGAQTNDMGGALVRTIGLIRAKATIGMKNLAYNMRRLAQLRRLNPNPA
ncbi:Transposase, Mutator family, partial [Paracoccus isoporae]